MSLRPLPTLQHAKPHLRDYATMLQAAMKRQNLDLQGLLVALGMAKKQLPAVYNWLTGKNGPTLDARVKLATVLGLTEKQVTAPLKNKRLPRETLEERARRLHRRQPMGNALDLAKAGPAQRAVVLAQQTAASSALLPSEPVRDVFTITGRSDGQISVQLRTTLDAQRGMALARFLMDFGLIIGDEREEGSP